MCSSDIFLGLLAIIFPPLAVWVKVGICSADSLINICLLMLGYLPGLIHAWYIIAKYPEPPYEYDQLRGGEEGRIYVYAHHGPANKPPGNQQRMNYGATDSGGPSSAAAQQQQQRNQQHLAQSQGVAAGPSAGSGGNGEGSSDGAPPPSYAAVVAGDNKVQTRD